MKLVEFNSQVIEELLAGLSDHMFPKWGHMSPRKMVHHLIDIARISNGKIKVDFANKPENLPKLRHILYKEVPFPKEFSAPRQVEALLKDDIEESLSELNKILVGELKHFEDDYADSRIETNAVFGPLNKADWIQFHRKHISHHLAQFGLWQY